MLLKVTKFNGKNVTRKSQIQFMLTTLAQSILPDDAKSGKAEKSEIKNR